MPNQITSSQSAQDALRLINVTKVISMAIQTMPCKNHLLINGSLENGGVNEYRLKKARYFEKISLAAAKTTATLFVSMA